jgi:hypothetical protein
VYQVLQALGYGDALSDHKVALLCLHFSAQLERAGLWHWAVFVLLHLKSAQGYVCVNGHYLGPSVGLFFNFSMLYWMYKIPKYIYTYVYKCDVCCV